MADTKSIFVFGSNLAGRHGKGAAQHALFYHGAKYGQGEGLQGNSYGIPTKGAKLEILSLREIKAHVDKFLRCARKNPDVVFKVTSIGTGYAGYKHDDIGPMFYFAPLNCILPVSWKPFVEVVSDRLFWIS